MFRGKKRRRERGNEKRIVRKQTEDQVTIWVPGKKDPFTYEKEKRKTKKNEKRI